MLAVGWLRLKAPVRQPFELSVTKIESRSNVDYALRTAQQNTLALSGMADQKASIVLGASFVIASIIFTGFDTSNIEPIRVGLGLTSVTSGLLAAFALLPKLPRPPTSGPSSKPNLLFFGTVAQMDHEQYLDQMRDLLSDDDQVYEAILEDLYQAAFAPARKFRLLRLSYLALMIGMVISLLIAAGSWVAAG